jgi:hypothetical protein
MGLLHMLGLDESQLSQMASCRLAHRQREAGVSRPAAGMLGDRPKRARVDAASKRSLVVQERRCVPAGHVATSAEFQVASVLERSLTAASRSGGSMRPAVTAASAAAVSAPAASSAR